MASFVQTVQNIFKIQELRERLVFTLGILIVVRIGAYITLPGINVEALIAANTGAAQSGTKTVFDMFDLFVGGAFSNAAIFALGIMPYITSSIIFQLAGIVIPEIQKLQKEGEEGRRRINQYTRVATVVIAGLQGWGVSIRLTSMADVVVAPGFLFTITAMLLLTAGTIFMMWLGEQITERGIGNGISLIIMIGIVARFPQSLYKEFTYVLTGGRVWVFEIMILAFLVAVIAGVILITQGARRIPVQYAKRVVGRKVMGGVTQYIPLRVNTAGVMPIIFAQALMFIPNTILSFFTEPSPSIVWLAHLLSPGSFFYATIYGLMVVFFTFFYTAIVFNPQEMADNMKKQGGYIPGIRPGLPTKEHIDTILTRITLPGSIFLAIVAILPTFAMNFLNIDTSFAQFFGGTSLLIIVGVALDTLQQIESYLLMRHYDGFMKSGKMKGRVGQGGF